MTTRHVSIEDLDVSFVPRFKEPVSAVPVADEAVLYESDTGDLHRLDQIASVVCSLFDGRTSVETAVDELAEAFEAPRNVIEADVLALVRDLGRKGLLEGVEPEGTDVSAVAQPRSDTPSASDMEGNPDDDC